MCAMSSIRKTPRKVIVERWHGCDARARKFGMASESAILGQLQGPLNAIGSQALNRHRRSLVEPVLVEPCVGMILKGIFHGRMETIGSFRSFSFWGGGWAPSRSSLMGELVVNLSCGPHALMIIVLSLSITYIRVAFWLPNLGMTFLLYLFAYLLIN